MSNAGSRFVCALVLVGVWLSGGLPALSAPSWVEAGPGPILNGQTQGLPDNPVAGAINAIAASTTNPDLVFVGTVNGGVWRTTNATADSPTWSPLTDQQLPGLSINSLAISPIDSNILFVGGGSTSSFAFDGQPGFGIARSSDGGDTWIVPSADIIFGGRRINSIVPTTLDGGNVVLAATLIDAVARSGVFRSTDMGDSFIRVSGNGSSGLPDQGVSSLVADPSNNSRFYAAVPAFVSVTGAEGVYRSDDGGVTWTAVNIGLTGLGNSRRILLAVHANNLVGTNAVYAAILSGGIPTLLGVFRSDNLGASWTALGVPSPEIFPGFQALQHGALAADPMDPNVVFISGDRQDSPFPNANGCVNFTGNTFRGDASRLPGSPWTSADCNGAQGTSPHADSRAMVFDANGNLLQANDGGLYRLLDPNNLLGGRQWSSVNGDINPTEFHSVAYDPLSGIIFGGAQDTGTSIQPAPSVFTWLELLQGDGGNVAIDGDQIAHPGSTIRYSSFQGFSSFNRTTWDAANTMVGGFTFVRLLITAGPGAGQTLFQFDRNIQFYQPFALNASDPTRLLIGTNNLYESLDTGDSLTNLGDTGFRIGNNLGASPMAYGGRLAGVPWVDVFYVGAGPIIFHRVTLGGPITALSGYPGGAVLGLVIDPENYRDVFVLDFNSRVWGSFDEGTSWIELTANLPTLTGSIRTIEIVRPAAAVRPVALLAGGQGGVFQLPDPETHSAPWTALSDGVPHGLVLDLHYNANQDVLVAGLLGRGAWSLTGFFQSNIAVAGLPSRQGDMKIVQEQPLQPSKAAARALRLPPPTFVVPPAPAAVQPESSRPISRPKRPGTH